MTERPFIAARIEEFVNRKVEAALRLFGWQEAISAYVGYGGSQYARIMGRVVLVPPRAEGTLGREMENLLRRRGWRNFMAAACVRVPARITVGDHTQLVWTDRGGYIDTRIADHGLDAGWQEVTIRSRTSQPTSARVLIVDDNQKFGIVSDLDDTVITTFLPRPLLAAYNSFVLSEDARKPVEGMAELYQSLLAEHPGAPVVYLSTGSYDTFAFLRRFLRSNGFPEGPMLLTDWGPTNTGWFRSGQEHKRRSLRMLARDLPNVKWLLVGDDGQHDPTIYAEFSQHLPKRVRAIAIRELTATEQVLAHGTPTTIPNQEAESSLDIVPEVRAPNGFGLRSLLSGVLAKRGRSGPKAHGTGEGSTQR